MFTRRFFAGSFDNAQLTGLVGQIADRVGGRVLGDRVGHEIQTAVDHFGRDLRERTRQGVGDGVGQIDQHGIQLGLASSGGDSSMEVPSASLAPPLGPSSGFPSVGS